jgi:ADP-heptose:LPS heptosyltransferase
LTATPLLIFHQGALGDWVNLFPHLVALRTRFQRIDVVCKSQIGALAQHLKLADRAYPSESALFAPLFGEGPLPPRLAMFDHYGTIVLFSYNGTLRQRVLSLTGAQVHLIPPRPATESRIHIQSHYTAWLEQLSVLPSLPAGATPALTGKNWRRPGFDPRCVLIHPGSGSRRKNWPLERFLALRQRLGEHGFKSSFLLGPAEAHLAAAQLHPMERPVDLVALAERLRSAGAFIGNDAGTAHLAAFLGLPTLAIFGPSDPARWRPHGRSTAIIQSADGCMPCFETNPSPCPTMDCLDRISVDTVMEAFLNLIA